ncbi:MAG: signal peptidase I [Actinobacteria bacterium]|nr:signal peptidase I [Actinomycetota bacterium]
MPSTLPLLHGVMIPPAVSTELDEFPADSPNEPSELSELGETKDGGASDRVSGVEVESRSRSSRRRWLTWTLDVLLVVAFAAAGVVVGGTLLGAWRFETVLSGSMRPGIQPGDVEVLRPEPVSQIRVGQIVAIHPPKRSFTVTHRVIMVRRAKGETFIKTKGDANNVADPWGTVRVFGKTSWRVAGVIPKLGYVTIWAKSFTVRLVLLIVVVGAVMALAIERIWRGS